MDFLSLLVLAVGLSMDAFAVSVCGGISLRGSSRMASGLRFGLWFGGFQALMPLLGFYGAERFSAFIHSYAHWIAFALLLYIGGNMVREADEHCDEIVDYGVKRMALLAVATSIDALAVGVSLALLDVRIWPAATTIGCVTFLFSFVGCVFGREIGVWGKKKAEIAGGMVLIGLGIKILAERYL